MDKIKSAIAVLVINLVFIVSIAFSLNVSTHEAINKRVAEETFDGFSLDNYLKNNLGFTDGIIEKISGEESIKIIIEGGRYEDLPYWYMPYLRSVNHFHNPLTDQGFSGIWGTGFLSGESSIQWSQKPVSTQSPGGYYSWHDTRDYFYRALTSQNKNDRDRYFADTFRGLGQLMHLVEDLSVPEHARDDGHYVSYNYEDWVNENQDLISNYAPIYFDSSVIGNPNPLASVPIANLFDTNQYNGTNPDITMQSDIGLSEYTNANFLSPDSMFTANFPYPNWANVIEYDDIDINGNTRTYLQKIGAGETIDHLAAGSWLYKYIPSFLTSLKRSALIFDERVYTDYAGKLIPRAVGYSAGLLNYFFRGEMDMIKDPNTGVGYIIENLNEEDMDGIFELYYDNINDERALLWSGNFALGALSSGNNISSNITFTKPADAKVPGKYMLAFRGRSGNEVDAVAASVFQEAEKNEFMIIFNDAGQTKYAFLSERQLENGEQVESNNYSFHIPPYGYDKFLFTVKSYIHRGKKVYIIKMDVGSGIECPPYAICEFPLGDLFLYDPEIKKYYKFPVGTGPNTQYTISENYIYLFGVSSNYGYAVTYYEPGQGIMQETAISLLSEGAFFFDSNGILYNNENGNFALLATNVWTGETFETGLNVYNWTQSSYGNYNLCPDSDPRSDIYETYTAGDFYPVTKMGGNRLIYTWSESGLNYDTRYTCVGACDYWGVCTQEDINKSLHDYFLDKHFYSSMVMHWTHDPYDCLGRDLEFDKLAYQILKYPFAIEDINNAYVMFYEEIVNGYDSTRFCSNNFITDVNRNFRVHLKTATEDLTATFNVSGYEDNYYWHQKAGLFFEDQFRQKPFRIHGAHVEFSILGSTAEFYPIYDITNNRIEQKIFNCLGGTDQKDIIVILPID